MILYVDGNYFTTPAQVLVNTVNTVGVMGKGLAKEFKRIYPEMFKTYQELCEKGKFKIGSLYLYKSSNKWILNFPTKKHWRFPSKIEYIEEGLKTFRRKYAEWGINNIAFPALGCGNGELDFENQVKPIMEKYLSNLPILVYIYPHKHNFYKPEHLTPQLIKEWLRAEPQYLSFYEVWEDIKEILTRKNIFRTLFKKSEFKVKLVEYGESEYLNITAKSNSFNINKNDILDFWQQLRRAGFITNNSSPSGLEKRASYLLPILLELPYITKVNIYYKKNKIGSTGLQFYEPNIYTNLKLSKKKKSEALQLSLF